MNEHDATEIAFKNGYKQGKTDTVREIQERLAVHFGTYTDKDMVKIREVFRLIDRIAKEMLEDTE